MNPARVLVVGGTGFFGRLIVDDLLRFGECAVVVASRRPTSSPRFETVTADLRDRRSLQRALTGITIAICAAGPYQQLPLTLVELCIERAVHYIDLADDRGFVLKVRSLVERSPHIQTAVCPAWSTVSALSGVLAKVASQGMQSVESIRIHMAPGNRGARQTATIASLLHSVGRPFDVFRDGEWQRVRGWSEPREFIFASPIGKRRGYLVDVPDHDIFPELFGARTVEFRAGSELGLLNRCVSVLASTRRNWAAWSGFYQKAAALLSGVGHDGGAIGVEVTGTNLRSASIIADMQGERIAALPAAVMTQQLLSGVPYRGLVSYADWLNGEQLRSECDRRGFRLILEAT